MAMGRTRGQIYRKLQRVYHKMETLGIEEKCWKTTANMVRDKEGGGVEWLESQKAEKNWQIRKSPI